MCHVLSELSKFNAFILLGDETNTDLVYKHRPERTGFNMYALSIHDRN